MFIAKYTKGAIDKANKEGYKRYCERFCEDFSKGNTLDNCDKCPLNNHINELGMKEDRQLNNKNRLTKESGVCDGYILKQMEESSSEMGCGELCFVLDGDCSKCDLYKALEILSLEGKKG